MKQFIHIFVAAVALSCLWQDGGPTVVSGQMLVPMAPPPNMNPGQMYDQLQIQVNWFQNATRTASMFNTGADTVLWTHFEGLRIAFGEFARSLNPAQAQQGANDLAELEAGLGIISEAFSNFQDDLNAGRNPTIAFRTLSQVLRDSVRLWGQQLRLVARRMQVGR